MYLWMLGAPQRGCLFIVAARYYGGAILEIHLAISSPLHILHYRWPFCLFFFHGHDFSYIVSHLLRVTIRSFLFRFSLRSLGLLLREPGDSRGFFFFFSFERTVVENSADLKIITKLERSSRSRDRLSSTNLHDSKRPINFRSKKFTR